MRVLGGRLRGRRLAAPPGHAVRPTGARVREALFDMLAHNPWGAAGRSALDGAVALDAFAGTGALGIEALSRGAARAIFLDRDEAALAVLRRNLRALGLDDLAEARRGDATRPGRAPLAATLAFLDPPYRSGLAGPALIALARAGWLAPGAVCVVEEAARAAFDPPPGFAPLDARRWGDTRVAFLRQAGEAVSA